MKALSIRQPWPWAIFNLGKDVENRSWRTHYRGRFLIHAGKRFDEEGWYGLRLEFGEARIPRMGEFERMRGGIVGSGVIRDCVQASASPWFFGPFGFVLQGVRPIPFIPYRGELGLFDVPDHLVSEHLASMA